MILTMKDFISDSNSTNVDHSQVTIYTSLFIFIWMINKYIKYFPIKIESLVSNIFEIGISKRMESLMWRQRER